MEGHWLSVRGPGAVGVRLRRTRRSRGFGLAPCGGSRPRDPSVSVGTPLRASGAGQRSSSAARAYWAARARHSMTTGTDRSLLGATVELVRCEAPQTRAVHGDVGLLDLAADVLAVVPFATRRSGSRLRERRRDRRHSPGRRPSRERRLPQPAFSRLRDATPRAAPPLPRARRSSPEPGARSCSRRRSGGRGGRAVLPRRSHPPPASTSGFSRPA